jgi:outer membrane immunogenic protein
MKLLSGILGVTLTSVVALASANAADMYVPSAPGPGGYKDACCGFSWAGFYAGVNGGYGQSANTENVVFFTSTGFTLPGKALNAEGGFGGGQAGYNWQRGAIVFGVEADIQGAGLTDSYRNQPDGFGDLSNAHRNIDYFGTVRARLGYAFDRTLVYGTGGFAYGGINNQNSIFNAGASANLSQNTTEKGFVVGGGIEYAISPAWSLKAEYQFIDLGSSRLFANVIPLNSAETIVSNKIDNSFNTVRVGLNYHIGPSYEPLK